MSKAHVWQNLTDTTLRTTALRNHEVSKLVRGSLGCFGVGAGKDGSLRGVSTGAKYRLRAIFHRNSVSTRKPAQIGDGFSQGDITHSIVFCHSASAGAPTIAATPQSSISSSIVSWSVSGMGAPLDVPLAILFEFLLAVLFDVLFGVLWLVFCCFGGGVRSSSAGASFCFRFPRAVTPFGPVMMMSSNRWESELSTQE